MTVHGSYEGYEVATTRECPYLAHPEHDAKACLHCASDDDLEHATASRLLLDDAGTVAANARIRAGMLIHQQLAAAEAAIRADERRRILGLPILHRTGRRIMNVPEEAITAAASVIGASIGRGEPSQLIAKRAVEAAAPFIAAAERQRAACCDLHGRNCEPPSELCCQDCTEARHPRHPPGEACANPDIARRAEELHADHHSGYIVPTLEAAEDAAITGGSWLDDLARASLGAADAKFNSDHVAVLRVEFAGLRDVAARWLALMADVRSRFQADEVAASRATAADPDSPQAADPDSPQAAAHRARAAANWATLAKMAALEGEQP